MNDQSWPAEKVYRRSVSKLRPYENNARTHSDAQIDQIVASIKEWGWTIPILIDEVGQIIAGHGRVMAAEKMGLDKVPVMVAKGWSEEQTRSYVLADNQLALNAGWDDAILSAELGDLKDIGVDLSLIGFNADELAKLSVGKVALVDEDETPETPEVPVSVFGDVWVLGDHRLVCGDSTSKDDVGELLGRIKPHLMVTDPPYGVSYDPDWRNRADRANGKPYGARAIGTVSNDDRADWREAWELFPGDVAYVWHAGVYSPVVSESLTVCDFEMRALIVWAKSNLVIGRGHYHHMHEPCWYAVRKKGTGHWSGDRKQTTLWQIDKPMKSETGHGTQKPVECMRRPIVNNSKRGDAVYDPFGGSGTTIIAAEMEGRRCFMMELDPKYCDVIIKRWQNYTGEVATLDGKAFSEVEIDRIGDENGKGQKAKA